MSAVAVVVVAVGTSFVVVAIIGNFVVKVVAVMLP